jgi:uncharacterized protein (UPF0248 family)
MIKRASDAQSDRPMMPLHELLNRIRWDAAFGAAQFELGYYDRVTGEIIFIPLKAASYERPDDENFALVDAEGRTLNIPFHRVRRVMRDGRLIWSRDPPL